MFSRNMSKQKNGWNKDIVNCYLSAYVILCITFLTHKGKIEHLITRLILYSHDIIVQFCKSTQYCTMSYSASRLKNMISLIISLIHVFQTSFFIQTITCCSCVEDASQDDQEQDHLGDRRCSSSVQGKKRTNSSGCHVKAVVWPPWTTGDTFSVCVHGCMRWL